MHNKTLTDSKKEAKKAVKNKKASTQKKKTTIEIVVEKSFSANVILMRAYQENVVFDLSKSIYFVRKLHCFETQPFLRVTNKLSILKIFGKRHQRTEWRHT